MVGPFNSLTFPKELIQHSAGITEFSGEKVRTISQSLVSAYEIKGEGIAGGATAQLAVGTWQQPVDLKWLKVFLRQLSSSPRDLRVE